MLNSGNLFLTFFGGRGIARSLEMLNEVYGACHPNSQTRIFHRRMSHDESLNLMQGQQRNGSNDGLYLLRFSQGRMAQGSLALDVIFHNQLWSCSIFYEVNSGYKFWPGDPEIRQLNLQAERSYSSLTELLQTHSHLFQSPIEPAWAQAPPPLSHQVAGAPWPSMGNFSSVPAGTPDTAICPICGGLLRANPPLLSGCGYLHGIL